LAGPFPPNYTFTPTAFDHPYSVLSLIPKRTQTLASFDQFSNLVLQNAFERKVLPISKDGVTYYVDIPLGIYIVRGDSVVLMGKVRDESDEQTAQQAFGSPLQGGMNNMTMKAISLDEWARLTASRRGDEPLQWDFDNDLTA